MPRYFFNVRTADGIISDDEGMQLADDAHAVVEADLSARDLLAAAVKRGDVIDGQSFEVTDETGRAVFTYPFRESVRLA